MGVIPLYIFVFLSTVTMNRIVTFVLVVTSLISLFLWLNVHTPPPLIDKLITYNRILYINNNLSGLTYDKEKNTLYAVINTPPEILNISTSGELISRVKLDNMEDTEGISYIGSNRFLIAEERKRRVTFVRTTSEGIEILKTCPVYDGSGKANLGTEGVTWSPRRNLLFTANEKKPAAVFVYTFPSNSMCPENPKMIYKSKRDIAGIAWDDEKERLFVLSEEGKTVTEIDLNGKKFRESRLDKFVKHIPQPEGIAVHGNHLYIVSEPNIFYKFKLIN